MNKIIISKLNNDENKIEWRISNSETGHYLNISISRALEDAMKKKRNLSFNRFESEQINNLSHLVTNIQEDYVLNIDESNISSSYLPLRGIDALSYMKSVE